MSPKELLKARRKLAFRIAEELAGDYPSIDIEDAAATINLHIPDTNAEAQAQFDRLGLSDDDDDEPIRPWPGPPSVFGKLRQAVHAVDGMSITCVMEAAVTKLAERERLTKQRDAWRLACRRIYSVIGEGGSRGRPMDLIPKREWQWIVEAIASATELDDAEVPHA